MFFGLGSTKISFGNEYDALHLQQLTETPNNELIVVISFNKSVKTSLDSIKHIENDSIREVLLGASQMLPDESQTYNIYFENHLMYQSRNESYAYNSDDDISIGKGLILFEKSKLLNYVNELIHIDSAIHMHNKSELRHYGIYTLNNIIDVVTFYEPVIRKAKHA